MYAVVVSGGKQHRVRTGEILRLEKLNVAPGDTFSFDQVLMVNDGTKTEVGSPLLSNTQVTAVVRSHGRADTIRVFTYKRRKKYRHTQGHRQWYTEVKVTAIKASTAKESTAKASTAKESTAKESTAKESTAKASTE